MVNDTYFYCYNKKVSDYLTKKGVQYITKAISPKDKRLFTMYKKDHHLDLLLNEYKLNS
jgi:hypothetical protein